LVNLKKERRKATLFFPKEFGQAEGEALFKKGEERKELYRLKWEAKGGPNRKGEARKEISLIILIGIGRFPF